MDRHEPLLVLSCPTTSCATPRASSVFLPACCPGVLAWLSTWVALLGSWKAARWAPGALVGSGLSSCPTASVLEHSSNQPERASLQRHTPPDSAASAPWKEGVSPCQSRKGLLWPRSCGLPKGWPAFRHPCHPSLGAGLLPCSHITLGSRTCHRFVIQVDLSSHSAFCFLMS